MPTYAYKAKDKSGKTIDGVLDAADAKAAAGMVREMGCWPLDISEQRAGRTAKRSPVSESIIAPIWSGVSIRSQALFFRQLATMLQAGMSLSEALDSLGKQKAMGRLPAIARVAADHVRSGGPFSDILARYPSAFTDMQRGLIRAGETGGMLDSMIERIAIYLEREIALRRKFSRLTFYPKIVAVFLFCIWLFLPHVIVIIDGGWSVVRSILWNQALPILLWALGIYIVIKLMLTVPPIRYAWDFTKLAFPVLGSLASKLAMATFSTALSVMYSAGVPLSQAVELASGAIGNEVLRRSVLRSIPQLRQGGLLSDGLRKSGRTPELVLGMISTGERTGSLDLTLNKVSEYYDSETDTTIDKLGYILFALLLVVGGIVVLSVLIKFYMGYARAVGL